ncbi:hypothetical protein ACSS6W_007805 [Trichoderma asperelloides]
MQLNQDEKTWIKQTSRLPYMRCVNMYLSVNMYENGATHEKYVPEGEISAGIYERITNILLLPRSLSPLSFKIDTREAKKKRIAAAV